MTNSKAPWLTRGGAIALMAAAAIALAACSGGGGLNEDEAAGLQQELKEARAQATLDAAARMTAVTEAALAQTEKETAEAEATAARTDQKAAETALKLAEETAAGQVSDAEADVETAQKAAKDALEAKAKADAALTVAQDKQKEAEVERDAAVRAELTARQQLQAEQQVATTEKQRREQAEAEQDRLAQENEEVRQQVTRADARLVRIGLGDEATGIAADSVVDPTVTPRYNASATVTATVMPSATFQNPTTGSLDGWFKTAFLKSERAKTDRLEVYSNVERPGSIPFKDSEYNVDNSIVNTAGMVFAVIDLGTVARDDTASGAFPRQSGPATTIPVNDRGITQDDFNTILVGATDTDEDGDIDRSEARTYLSSIEMGTLETLLTTQYSIDRQELNRYVSGKAFRDTVRYPDRWEYTTSGTLGGASGTYRCAGGSNTERPSCTVRNTGSEFIFSSLWTFSPSSGTTGVRVEDTVYIYFGWWSRQITEDGSWQFKAFFGPEESQVDAIGDVTGTATYRGPAAGYYAIYEPATSGSEHGAFTATATLNADFDNDEVSGTIDGFSGHPNWSLALETGAIDPAGSTGQSTNGVTWTIGTTPASAGDSWEAHFYSNIVADDPKTGATETLRDGVMPNGIAGTFSATYDDVGRLTGAFGAHCVDVVCRP